MFTLLCALADIKLKAEHLSGLQNTIAEAISWNNNYLQVLFSSLWQRVQLPNSSGPPVTPSRKAVDLAISHLAVVAEDLMGNSLAASSRRLPNLDMLSSAAKCGPTSG